MVPLEALRPTQAVVGMRAVAAKREKVASRTHKRKKMQRFLEKRPIPAFLGPGESYFIVDHHHLSLALWQSEIDEVFVRAISDFSSLAPGAFWRAMTAIGCAHLYDEDGHRIAPSQLPRTICDLRPDHYRDLAWSVREEGGFEKTREPYAEFRWAEYFRRHIPLGAIRRDYDKALDRALLLSRDHEARRLPGYLGR